MPFSERKGRFLVTTACFQPVSSAAAASPAISATSSDQRVQKRNYGRFTVSTCQAYASSSSSPADTQATRPGDALQLTSSHRNASFSSMSSSERDGSPFGVADQQHQQQACDLSMSSWDSSSSLCSKASSCSTAKQAAATPTRRVRFSEPDCCAAAPATPARYCGTCSNSSACAVAPAAIKQQPVLRTAVYDSAAAYGNATPQQQQQQQHYLISPTGSVPKPIMRSYCRGRFVVQEAVLYSGMPRSMSVPEHSCTLEQFIQANAAAVAAADQQDLLRHGSGSSNASDTSSSSGGCCRQILLQEQQQQQAVLTQAVVAAAAASDSFWAAASAAHLSDTIALGCTMSDDFAAFSNAAAAAAVGMPGRAARPYHHPPKRSQTVSYFRRGRFLVQTTYS